MSNDTKVTIQLSLLVLIGLFVFSKSQQKQLPKKTLDPKTEDPEISKKYNFHLIPDGRGNYRSAQIMGKDLEYIIKKYNIKNIIRMNGDGSDGKHMKTHTETPRDEEKGICESLGCTYNFIDSHKGYVKNKGYVQSLNNVTPILRKGNTLIHCAHGADRTGGLVGGYLKNEGFMTNKDDLWQYTTQYNSWNRMIAKGTFFGSGYDKYADTFYPIDELKNSKWAK